MHRFLPRSSFVIRGLALAVASFLMVLTVGVSQADACSCISVGPACQAIWRTDAVFDATVLSIEPSKQEAAFSGRTLITEHLVKLNVQKGWKGIDAGPVEVGTNPDGASCGFNFKIGRRYIVFAHRRAMDGRLSVSLCSLTREFDGTGETANFLASLAEPETGGRAFGSIDLVQTLFRSPDGSFRTPMNLAVRLRGNGRSHTTTSNAGRYEFTGLAPGHYEIEIVVPEGYSTRRAAEAVELPNSRACAQTDFWIAPAGRIIGQLVDKSGRSLQRVKVEVTRDEAPADRRRDPDTVSAETDSNGYFEVGGLPPGRYLAGVNLRDLPNQWNPYARTFYPGLGEPHAIELALGQAVDLGRWELPPPLPVVRMSGWIAWRDGTPAAGVFVAVWDVTGNAAETGRGAGGSTAASDGRFVIEVREGRAYTFMARAAGNGPRLPLSALRIEARQGQEPVRLVIQRDPPQ